MFYILQDRDNIYAQVTKTNHNIPVAPRKLVGEANIQTTYFLLCFGNSTLNSEFTLLKVSFQESYAFI